MSEPVLVVDFGTTTSSSVLVTAEGAQVVREPGSDRDWWPSAVCVDGDDVLVGSPAEQLKRFDPAAYRAEFKPDLGEREPIPLGEKSFLPQDLVAEVLAAIAAEARQLNGGPVAHAVLTVPASYGAGDPRRDLMIEAGERVGFAEVELLPEPVAAAFAPVRGEPFAPGEVVLVYDFGGGTFDAALMEIAADGRHRVLGHDAEAACGGRDMDAALRRRLRELGGERLTALLTGDRTTAGHIATELGELVRRVKHHLSDAATARDFLHAAALRVTMERAELAALCRPVVAPTLGCCRSLLAAHDVKPVAALLVGGTCRMPLVAEAVAAELGLPVRFAKDVSTAVVQGAAEWARHAGDRVTSPAEPETSERPLRWDLPGGSATLVRWLIEPDAGFDAGTALASVRLADGTLHRLTAGDAPGTLVRSHAAPGTTVTAHDWLATTGPAAVTAVRTGRFAAALAPSVFNHGGTVTDVALCAGGQVLCTIGKGVVAFWDVADGSPRHTSFAVDAARNGRVTCSADGKRVAATCWTTLAVWDSCTGALLFRYDADYPVVDHVSIDDAGKLVAAGRRGNLATVWNVDTGRLELEARAALGPYHPGYETRSALSPDGRRLATGHIAVKDALDVVLVRTVDTDDVLLMLHAGNAVCDLTFAPDGRRIAALIGEGNEGRTGLVWDASTGNELVRFVQPAQGRRIKFSRDGALLATAGGDNVVRIWEAGTGSQVSVVEQPAIVNSAVFDPTGSWLATACDDGKARLIAVPDRH
ncbi:Hsp70 family protein [uncultured Pseudonocardia sp.]|uniref:Hsp70 family protein n=1 Tax=uncultured Pseudonocardia sp. TaxID=211455 RepID=UPI002624225D|nr:Hsp70 family protein [uncultured Pseudonocardia sp.]